MLRQGNFDVKLCPRCYLSGRLERLRGSTLSFPCLACGRVYTPTGYAEARAQTYRELTHRINAIVYKEVEDVGAVAI